MERAFAMGFFVFIMKFNYSVAPNMRRLLEMYTDKEVIILHSPSQAEKYLKKYDKAT